MKETHNPFPGCLIFTRCPEGQDWLLFLADLPSCCTLWDVASLAFTTSSEEVGTTLLPHLSSLPFRGTPGGNFKIYLPVKEYPEHRCVRSQPLLDEGISSEGRGFCTHHLSTPGCSWRLGTAEFQKCYREFLASHMMWASLNKVRTVIRVLLSGLIVSFWLSSKLQV